MFSCKKQNLGLKGTFHLPLIMYEEVKVDLVYFSVFEVGWSWVRVTLFFFKELLILEMLIKFVEESKNSVVVLLQTTESQ